MRLLHTSDWHLGRTLHGEPLLEHQRRFLRWLRELAVAREVDAVLVAGDVYDRALPSVDAVLVLDEALREFAEAGVPVLITSGNHDSAVRLGFGRSLARAAGIHLRTSVAELADPLVLLDGAGPVGVYGIPYLLPDAVLTELDCPRSHAGVLRAAVGRIRADAARRGIGRTVVLAHAFVTGARGCDSERDLAVGGIGDAPADVFDGVSYAALGHLHAAQQVTERVAYSGSPLAFSFSERDHAKSVSVIELDAAGRAGVELVAAPVPRPLREVHGTLDEILARAQAEPALADAWIKAVLTDAGRPAAPMERLRERLPHTLALDFRPAAGGPAADVHLPKVDSSAEPLEICNAFVEWVDSTRPDAAQRDTLRAAVEAIRRAELSA